MDLPLTRGLLPAGTDVDADLGGLGVLDRAAELVARAGRSSATSASSLVLGVVSSRQGGTLLFGEWYEAADGLDTTSGGGSGGAGITGGGNGGSGTDALAVELATTGTGGAGGDAGGAGGPTDVWPLATWVILIFTLCLLGGGATGGCGCLSKSSASSTGSTRASRTKRWPAATSNLRASSCGGSLPSLSVSGLSIATFTTPRLGSKLEVAKTVLEARKDGSRHTLSGRVCGSTPIVESTESPGTM